MMDNAATAFALNAIARKLTNPYRPLRAVFAGDSITDMNCDNSNGIYGYLCWWTCMQWLCGGKIIAAKNSGIPGDTSFGLSARFLQDCLSYQPDVVFILIGRNDINAAGTINFWTPTFVEAMILAALGRGVTPVVVNIPPYGFSATNPTSTTLAVATQTNTYNAALNALAAKYGVPYCDVHTPLADPSGLYYASAALSTDGTHPTLAGSVLMAQAVYGVIQGLLPNYAAEPSLLNTIYSLTTTTDNFNPVPNGFFNGSSTVINGGGTAPFYGWGGSGSFATRLLVNDGACIGNWWRFSWAQSGATGSSYPTTTNIPVKELRGKRVMLRCKVRTSSGFSAAGNTVSAYIYFYTAAGTLISKAGVSNLMDGTGFLAVEGPVPASANYATVQLGVSVVSTALAGNADFAEVVVREVNGISSLTGIPGTEPAMACLRVTANTTLTPADRGIIEVDASGGAVTITLPPTGVNMFGVNAGYGGQVIGDGLAYRIVKIDSSANAVTIVPQGSDTLNGGVTTVSSLGVVTGSFLSAATTYSIANQWGEVDCKSSALTRYVVK